MQIFTMKNSFKWVILTLILGVCVGQVTADSPFYTIAGQVTDTDGRPIAGIEVTTARVYQEDVDVYEESMYARAITDENGNYVLYVSDGKYYLDFEFRPWQITPDDHTDYPDVTYLNRWYGDLSAWYGDQVDETLRGYLTVVGEDLTGINVVMKRGGTVSGSIAFGAGVDPVTPIYVHLEKKWHDSYWYYFNDGDTVYNDELYGAGLSVDASLWAINRLAAGTYRVCANYRSNISSEQDLSVCHGEFTLDDEETMENIKLTLQPPVRPPHSISGSVRATDGTPLDNIEVKASSQNDRLSSFYTHTDADGEYELFVPADRYRLKFYDERNRYEDSQSPNIITITDEDVANTADTNGVLNIVSGLDGTLFAEAGKPFRKAKIALYQWITAENDPDVDGYWLSGGYHGNDSEIRAADDLSADPDATLTQSDFFIPAQAGSYRVCAVVHYGDEWGSEIGRGCHGGGVTPDDGADVLITDDTHLSDIDIQIVDVPKGTVTGVITDDAGNGVADVSVSVGLNHLTEFDGYTSIKTAEDGSYSLDLLPGTYSLAFYSKSHLDERYDEFAIDLYDDIVTGPMEQYVDYTPVVITSGETVTINESLVKGARINGTLTLSEPNDILGGSVSFTRVNSESGDQIYYGGSAEIQPDGSYQSSKLAGGTYSVCYYVDVSIFGYRQCVSDVNVRPTVDNGETVIFDFELDIASADVSSDNENLASDAEIATSASFTPLNEEDIVATLFLPAITFK